MKQIELRDEIIEASESRGIALEETVPDPARERVEEGIRFIKEYEIGSDLQVSLRFWDDTQWTVMAGSEYWRWIFQPSGMCEPMRVRVEAEKSFFEVEFHPLTADVKSERSLVE